MKILLLNDDFPPRGDSSVSSVVGNLAEGFINQGHDVTIITTHRTSVSKEIIREGNVISLPASYRISLVHYLCLYRPGIARMLKKEISKIQPDVVHAHNIHIYLTYHALQIARKHTKRVFITMHDAMSFSFARVATERFLQSDGKDARTTSFDHIKQAGLQWNPLRNMIIRSILKRNVKKVIAVSHALASALKTHGIGNVEVIHHGIDVSKWSCQEGDLENFRQKYGLKGRKVIFFGGRLSKDKGAIPLLQALNMLRKDVPNVTLLVAGKKERWWGLLQAADVPEDLNEHIVPSGWLDKKDMRTAYFASDVVTTPSLCLDTFNLMNLEAMAASKPVVGTIFGGTPEVVEDCITGFLINPLDIDKLAQALRTLLANPKQAKAMGEAGRKRSAEHFPLSKQISKHLSLYE